jgi:hypothetical protein
VTAVDFHSALLSALCAMQRRDDAQVPGLLSRARAAMLDSLADLPAERLSATLCRLAVLDEVEMACDAGERGVGGLVELWDAATARSAMAFDAAEEVRRVWVALRSAAAMDGRKGTNGSSACRPCRPARRCCER